MSTPIRQTPLHAQHVALGARMVPFAGWSMPVQYAGIVKEHHAVRSQAGLFDVSHMGELELSGRGAEAFVDRLITNNIKRLNDGQALYTVCCHEGGGILDDLIVYRIDAERFWIVCNASNRDKIVAHIQAQLNGSCNFEDRSDETALIALQGPHALKIAESLSPAQLSKDIPRFYHAEQSLAEIECRIARTGYTGEDGVEIFCDANDAEALWTRLLDAGQKHGLVPAGLGARDTLRLEACLPLYGNELDEETDPYTAGLAWVVKLKERSFIGRDALAQKKAQGPAKKLIGFEMSARGIARHGYPIVQAGKTLGIVTSGGPGPTVGKNIGLGYVPTELSQVGQSIEIEIRGRTVEAVIVNTPFYKR